MHSIDHRRPHWLAGVSPFLVMAAGAAGLAGSGLSISFAESADVQPNPSAAAGTFAEIVKEGTRRTFREVAGHLASNPAGTDAEEAHRWFFATAREYGWEADAASAAERYLERSNGTADTRRLAGEVRVLSAARGDEPAIAIEQFDKHLASIRLRSSDTALRLGIDLSARAQLAGDFAAARAVFERLPRHFPLNPQVNEFCDNRLAKLELIGRKAPEVGVRDLSGDPVSLADFAGRVVLLTFWATDCPPCLEELPRLKRLDAKHGPQGFSIVGISLDEQAETVDEFRKRRELSWRLALSSSDRDATRGRYRARTIPAVFVIGRSGRIAYADLSGRELETAIERLVNDDRPR